nr:WASH complex subunit 1 [Leptinotarsa decemlineata]
MDSKYSVPIIPQNLYKHETIVQIADVLDHLSNITDEIFSQINKRLESSTEKLSDISHRVDIVNKKINTLKGAKKATQVFSSSKYPATNVYKEYTSVFHDSAPIELKRHNVKLKSIPSTYEPVDKLQFYHVNVNNKNKKKMEGLGGVPQDIDFVNDLLLYNSGKNLYKHFVISDALKGPQNIREAEENISEIGAAPYSISERSTMIRSRAQSYFYAPQIEEVPALDVPLDLPDLPGIADDLHYDSELGPGIAPSADISQTVLELELESSALPTINQIETELEKEDIPVSNLPPLPPPPPEELPKPPPEPKPANDEEIKEIKNQPEVVLRNHIPPPQDDMRSSLMEAIRNAGGKGKAKLKPVEENKKPAVKVVPQGGDLMADLHNKLFMRRKGISGAKQPQENSIDADSTLSRISAMIPPPDPRQEQEVESTSNDEDWEE